MVAIVTGDIINSGSYPNSEWLVALKEYLSTLGNSPDDWEVYRGDEFQLRINREDALRASIYIKALLKSSKGLDVRMGIGLGTELYRGLRVAESNGPAYHRSGRNFDLLKESKCNLTIATGDGFYDDTLNLMLRLALDFMDDWSPVSAEIVALVLADPSASQTEIAKQLDIQQSAVSQRQKRARLDLVFELLAYYDTILNEIY